MKKNILFLVALVAFVGLVSCESKSSNIRFGINTNGSYGRLDSTGVEATRMTLYYNSAWEARFPDWVSLSPVKGTPAKAEQLDTVQLYVKGMSNETGAIRKGRIQIVAPNGVDLSFDVWQNPQPAPRQ